jgi:hypothetical protein
MRRPWGHIDKWFSADDVEKWDVIGTCGFEDRSVAALEEVATFVRRAIYLRLSPTSPRGKDEVKRKITVNQSKLESSFPKISYFDAELLDPPRDFIQMIDEWIETKPTHVLVDMSSMPKRFLAILLKRVLACSEISEVLVAYTIPYKYTEAALAEDQAPIRALPAFSKEELVDMPIEHLIIGIGYIPFDLSSAIDSAEGQPSRNVIFPFPPGAPSFQRNWKLLANLFGSSENFPEPIRVDSRDVSYAFDVIDDITNRGTETCVLLPFGPKPHSLAMILHSIFRTSEVRYTQPEYYNPEYSSGVRRISGRQEVYAYAVRLNSTDLYA